MPIDGLLPAISGSIAQRDAEPAPTILGVRPYCLRDLPLPLARPGAGTACSVRSGPALELRAATPGAAMLDLRQARLTETGACGNTPADIRLTTRHQTRRIPATLAVNDKAPVEPASPTDASPHTARWWLTTLERLSRPARGPLGAVAPRGSYRTSMRTHPYRKASAR